MTNRNIALLTGAGCTAFYLINIYLSSGIYDASDGLAHYAIARYAPKHPELFLDHWGKPLFTLIAAPFTAFGIKGVMVLSTLLYSITALLLVLLGRKLSLRFTWVLPLFLAAIPVYFQVVMSGLTEVLFAAVLVAGLFAFAIERFWLAALIITWLPFARSEAYFVVPLFVMAFIAKRQFVPVLLLAVGPLLMSFVGWLVLGDFLWIIHNNPYIGAKEIYGSGSFWHFTSAYESISGKAIFFTATGGIILAFWRLIRVGLSTKTVILVLAALIVLSVFFGHSFFWANGLYGSLGLLRVIATVAPLFALLSLFFISAIAEQLVRPKMMIPAVLLVAVFSFVNLQRNQTFFLKPEGYEIAAAEMGAWYRKSPYANSPNVWFMYPLVGYFLDIDDREPINSSQLWNLNRLMPSNSIRENGLIIWEAQHAPSEGNTSREALLADKNLHLIERFECLDKNAQPIAFEVFVKSTAQQADTLVFENFEAKRPILEGRLNRIGADHTGRRYFDLITITRYTPVYTFWRVDSNVWRAPYYKFWFVAEEELEVWLTTEYVNGLKVNTRWRAGVFSLPEMGDDVVSTSIGLRNPKSQEAVKAYEWGLVKLIENAGTE